MTGPNGASSEKTVYVLGSGASLSDLTARERDYIRSSVSVAMNKYLLFWECIGIWPTHYFLADIHWPAPRVYEESLAIAGKHTAPPHFLLADVIRQRYSIAPWRLAMNVPFAWRTHQQHGYCYRPWLRPREVTWFRRVRGWDSPEIWGESLADLMYFYRGSLSVLLNVLTVLRLGRHIKLLGVDLGTPGSFYDAHLEERPWLEDEFTRLQRQGEAPVHMTAKEHLGMPGIQHKWSFIQREVEQRGFTLHCCNPESLLVREGLCPYAPVGDG